MNIINQNQNRVIIPMNQNFINKNNNSNSNSNTNIEEKNNSQNLKGHGKRPATLLEQRAFIEIYRNDNFLGFNF